MDVHRNQRAEWLFLKKRRLQALKGFAHSVASITQRERRRPRSGRPCRNRFSTGVEEIRTADRLYAVDNKNFARFRHSGNPPGAICTIAPTGRIWSSDLNHSYYVKMQARARIHKSTPLRRPQHMRAAIYQIAPLFLSPRRCQTPAQTPSAPSPGLLSKRSPYLPSVPAKPSTPAPSATTRHSASTPPATSTTPSFFCTAPAETPIP